MRKRVIYELTAPVASARVEAARKHVGASSKHKGVTACIRSTTLICTDIERIFADALELEMSPSM